jgi:hypothetical protein
VASFPVVTAHSAIRWSGDGLRNWIILNTVHNQALYGEACISGSI